MHYYLLAINILVNDLKLNPDEAIKRLRLPDDTAEKVYKAFIEIKLRELNHLTKSNAV
ncbi:hypothetical protein [Enterobacter kobei]|uniref:hypothetical protein n=1 Tax=Enterobacter kobei TaxID=208224 RepID=UPI0032AEFF98